MPRISRYEPRGRYQPFRANWRISNKIGNWYSSPPPPYEETLQRLSLHFLKGRRLRVDLSTAFKIFTGLLDGDPKFVFSLPLIAAIKGTHTKYSKVRTTVGGEGQLFRWGLWNIGISSRLPSLQLLLSMFSRRGLRKFGQKSFSIFPIDWNLISSIP